jgi:hypothetical protein
MKRLFMLLIVAILVLMPVAAEAHPFTLYQGKDKVVVGSYQTNGIVYDRECDSHNVYAVLDYNGDFGMKLSDPEGCHGHGASFKIGKNAVRIKVCEYADEYKKYYCSDWHKITPHRDV